ncbi:hypothetical protein [Kushneria sp. TE3]|uniref:hypothetical protein n=1 Tax=Kushneria sp. TE3 TaxID=3449832 RepID=UPI003F687B3F
MSPEQQTQTAGAATAPQGIPDDVRLTLMAIVTGRMIEMRRQPESAARDYELSRLIPAAQWLTGENGE